MAAVPAATPISAERLGRRPASPLRPGSTRLAPVTITGVPACRAKAVNTGRLRRDTVRRTGRVALRALTIARAATATKITSAPAPITSASKSRPRASSACRATPTGIRAESPNAVATADAAATTATTTAHCTAAAVTTLGPAPSATTVREAKTALTRLARHRGCERGAGDDRDGKRECAQGRGLYIDRPRDVGEDRL